MSSEEGLKQQLEELQKQLGKKQKFKDAVSSIENLVRDFYPTASPSLRKSFYSVVCRVAAILKTRYTSPAFWFAGLALFQEAEGLVSDSSEKEHLRNCIAQGKEHLHLTENPPAVSSNSSRGGYLFEGHLTVDPEPLKPEWLVLENLSRSMYSFFAAESSRVPVADNNTTENAYNILEELIRTIDHIQPEILEDETTVPKPPPASKEVVAKLPVSTLTEEILAKLGQGAECAICKENMVVDDKMQELPCKHTFHPPCLKEWLEKRNSCPVCLYELQTDDHAYESWKEQEKEAEEERKGAANAVRGEYLYI